MITLIISSIINIIIIIISIIIIVIIIIMIIIIVIIIIIIKRKIKKHIISRPDRSKHTSFRGPTDQNTYDRHEKEKENINEIKSYLLLSYNRLYRIKRATPLPLPSPLGLVVCRGRRCRPHLGPVLTPTR